MNNYVITIARGFGSGGKAIGERLARELGIPCYEQEILKMASEYSGLNEALFKKGDEKLGGSFLYNLVMRSQYRETLAPSNRNFVSNDNLYSIQKELIRKLAMKESCIIVGKCANHILKGRQNVISVYIEASRDHCLKRIMEKYQLEEKEANKLIDQTEKYRYDYYRYYTGGEDWRNPVSYDLILNSGNLSEEACAGIIKGVVAEKMKQNFHVNILATEP